MLPVPCLVIAEMSCEPGWALYMNQCLLFNDTVLDWMEAQNSCQGQSARLVTVQDDSKQAFINGIYIPFALPFVLLPANVLFQYISKGGLTVKPEEKN